MYNRNNNNNNDTSSSNGAEHWCIRVRCRNVLPSASRFRRLRL